MNGHLQGAGGARESTGGVQYPRESSSSQLSPGEGLSPTKGQESYVKGSSGGS